MQHFTGRPYGQHAAPSYFNMNYEYFKLKCEKDYVSVLALRGMGTIVCRQTTP